MTISKYLHASKHFLRVWLFGSLLCLLFIATFTMIFKKFRRVRNLIRQASKYGLNPFTLMLAGKSPGLLATIQHTGRRSGRLYTTPVLAIPAAKDFIIPLTYGQEADWARNILATGTCTVFWQGQAYPVGNPEIIHRATALARFPWPIRIGLSIFRITRFLKLTYSCAAR